MIVQAIIGNWLSAGKQADDCVVYQGEENVPDNVSADSIDIPSGTLNNHSNTVVTDATIQNVCPSESTLEKRCEYLSDSFGLSPREREILHYYSYGNNADYIAKTLVISKNTVYTHIRNIYHKLNIKSRQELLSMLHNQ